MHPDHVVGLDERRQRVGEQRVDPQISGELDRGEFGQIDPIVQDRPQHAVGEAVVIILEIDVRQIERNECPPLPSDHRRLRDAAILGHPPAPAEPDPLALFERRVDRDGEAAGLRRLGAGDRDPVRDYDETRHHTSSHLIDRRIAELMMPAIE